MVKIYSPKLTEAQYFHVMEAMRSYGYDAMQCIETEGLHKRTEEALMKAQDK
tara:strand:+ start:139 stop:294 length:156 start_codon:yes stop_codon:yes gene_type:complete